MKPLLWCCASWLFAIPGIAQPSLNFSVTFGGSRPSQPLAMSRDANQNLYVAGNTEATNLATFGAFQTAFSGTQDAFVAEFNTNGALVFATYLGGSGAQSAQSIAVDAQGNIFVAGYTTSTDFPTKNPLQATNAGGYDAFVTELSPGGSALVFSTYLGGKGFDSATGIALDTNNSLTVGGYTQSTNFPTANALQPAYGGNGDAFVARFAPGGGSLVYSTYLGGTDSEDNASAGLVGFTSSVLANLGGALAADSSGNAYVTGWTYSTNFPIRNAFQTTNATISAGLEAAGFVTKIDPAGRVVYSTYFGGQFGDYSRAIGIDSSGNAYFAGNSAIGDLPTTNAYQPFSHGSYSFSGSGDGFLAALDASGTNLLYCTYLGGSGDEQINAISVRPDGVVAVTGVTDSPDFPVLNPIQSQGGQGCFISTTGGAAWTASKSGLTRTAISALALDPLNASTLYALAGSLCKSSDGGQHWQSILSTSFPTARYSSQGLIAFDPGRRDTLYLGAYAAVMKSMDGGTNWTTLTAGLPANPNIQALAVDPGTPSTLYAGTYSGGVFKSTNGGTNWTAMNTGLPSLNQGVTALLVDPQNSSHVYAGIYSLSTSWLYQSLNGGANWTAVSGLPNFDDPVVAMAVNPANPAALYVLVGDFLNNATLCLTTNGGANWSQPFQFLNSQIWSLAVAAPPAPVLTIGLSGTNVGLSWPSTFLGYALQATPTLSPVQWQNVAQAPSVLGGYNFVTLPSASTEAFYKLVHTNPAPLQPYVYLGTDQSSQQGLLRSTDGGTTWQDAGLAGGTVNAVAVKPSDPNTVYAGLGNGFDAFISTFTPQGKLYASTYLGGSGADRGFAIALDASQASVAVSTISPDFPLAGPPNLPAHPLDVVESPPVENPPDIIVAMLQCTAQAPCPPDQTYQITATNGVPINFEYKQFHETHWDLHGDSGGLVNSILVGPYPQTNYGYIRGTPTAVGTITFEVVFHENGCVFTYTFIVTVKSA